MMQRMMVKKRSLLLGKKKKKKRPNVIEGKSESRVKKRWDIPSVVHESVE